MRGSMRRRGSAWELRVYLGADPVNGKQHSATKTVRAGKREAQRSLNEMIVEADRGLATRTAATVGELLDRWLQLAREDFSLDLTELIEARPGIRSGKPCFVGTRIAVYDVLDYLASGMTAEEIVADFPELTERHVRAAIEFAALRERRLATPA